MCARGGRFRGTTERHFLPDAHSIGFGRRTLSIVQSSFVVDAMGRTHSAIQTEPLVDKMVDSVARAGYVQLRRDSFAACGTGVYVPQNRDSLLFFDFVEAGASADDAAAKDLGFVTRCNLSPKGFGIWSYSEVWYMVAF